MTDVEYCKFCYHPKTYHHPIADGSACNMPGCECKGFELGETRVTNANGASKGTKDARYDLIPIPALEYLAKLYGFGAKKYAEHNWRHGYDWSKSYAAAQRHLTQFWAGEDYDPESGAPHVINVAFHMFALATYLTEHPELDDRFETRESRSDEEKPTPDVGELYENAVKAMAMYYGKEGPIQENTVEQEGNTLTIILAPNIDPKEIKEQIKHLIEVRSHAGS